jgi:hypothetical protein
MPLEAFAAMRTCAMGREDDPTVLWPKKERKEPRQGR